MERTAVILSCIFGTMLCVIIFLFALPATRNYIFNQTAGLSTQHQTILQEHTNLTEENNRLRAEKASLVNTLNECVSELNTSNRNLNTLEDAYENVATEINNLFLSLNLTQTTIPSNTLEVPYYKLQDIQNYIFQQQLVVIDLENNVRELEQNLALSNNDVASLNQQISDLNYTITTKNMEIENLQIQVNNLQNELDSCYFHLEILTSQVNTLFNKTGVNESDLIFADNWGLLEAKLGAVIEYVNNLEQSNSGPVETTYQVVFMVDGVEYHSYSSAPDVQVVLPENPTADGRTFAGWSNEPNPMFAIPVETIFVTADLTFYAVWQ